MSIDIRTIVFRALAGNRASRWCRVALATLMIPGVAMAVSEPTVTFKTNILQQSCAVTFESPPGTAVSGTLSLKNVASSALKNCQTSAGQCLGDTTEVKIVLKNCGVGKAGVTPTVTVTGVAAIQADFTGNIGNPVRFAFRNAGAAGGTAKEYFVALGRVAKPQWTDNTGGIYGVGQAFPLGAKGDSGDNLSVSVFPALSCGSTGWTGGCDFPSMKAGTVNASLQFDFNYK